MPWLKQARQSLEVLVTRLGLLVVPPLPRPWLIRLARLLGWLGYRLDRRGRNVGWANLHLAFPSMPASRKQEILKASFHTFALVLLDILWFTRESKARLIRHVHVDADLAQHLFLPKSQLCVTAHLGNWEILGQAVSLRGFPLHSVATPLKNPGVEALFTPLRVLTGQVVLHKQGVLRPLLAILRGGKKVGILLDQNTPPSEGGLFVPFFGVPVPVASAPAAIAVHAGSEVLFAFCIPTANGDYRALWGGCLPPCADPPADDAADRLTAQILSVIESVVTRYPEHWLWSYKRWKWIPPEADPSVYPPYARPLPSEEVARARTYRPPTS